MRALKVAVVVMAVLIVAGVLTLAGLIARRVATNTTAPGPAMVLDEPAGTRIAGGTATGDRLAVVLQGGGPDRIAVVDLRSGQVLRRIGLAR